MTERTFAERLIAVIDNDPDLNDAGLAKKAGLSDSVIRKMRKADTKSPRMDTARRICAALGTTLEDFMSGAFEAGHGGKSVAKGVIGQTGFAEDGAAFIAKPKAPDLAAFPDARDPQAFRVIHHHFAFGLLKGDTLVVDMAATAAPGTLAIVTRADLDTGEASTLIRRVEDHGILSDDPAAPFEPWNGPGYNYAALGRVVGVVRRM